MTTSGKHEGTPQVIGPSFVSLQVRDLEVSKKFYLEQIGLKASRHMPPGAVIFETTPIPFAIRTPMVDLEATSKLGWGVSLWIAATDPDALHAELVEKGVPIVLPPADGPFGRFFSFRDPDGYAVRPHSKAGSRVMPRFYWVVSQATTTFKVRLSVASANWVMVRKPRCAA